MDKDINHLIDLLLKFFYGEQLRKRDSQIKAMKSEEYMVTYILDSEGIVIGFMFWWDFSWIRFIEYLFVDEHYQRQGLGSKLLTNCLFTTKPVVVEVESNTETQDFYIKNGFHENSYIYSPIKINEYEQTIHYSVFSYKKKLTKDQYKDFIETINEEKYQF